MEKILMQSESDFYLPYEVQKLEEEEIITSNQNYGYTEFDDIPLDEFYAFLYHGIRFQTYLEKLESIFRDGKILAGRHIENYYCYGDNCNRGEYVSLLNRFKADRLSFATFIEENITLLVARHCDAIETKYVDFSTWNKIKDLNLKQIYSYMLGECMCKDFVPLEYVKAVGVPYRRLIQRKGIEYADQLLEDVVLLMEKYNVSLPVVDISRFNELLVSPTMDADDNVVQREQRGPVFEKKLS